jgi:2-polyprenyl-3-methyl-5-hydroxy-6-metoxy-1,4-benzoquinol methylase
MCSVPREKNETKHPGGSGAKSYMATAQLTSEKVHAGLEDSSTCFLCSREGNPVYHGLRDYTFGAAGAWNYRECPQCGLLWLSPRPVPSDMGQFYATYLTHQAKKDHGRARRVNDKFKLALWARALGRPDLAPDGPWSLIARIFGLDPFVRELGTMGTMQLSRIKPGRLLDVGCGNGSFLSLMQSAGWKVAGLEPDPKAARLASERLGVPIPGETLRDTAYPAASFDAVTLQHVIEHVYDPVGEIAECRRILKPGGLLVIVTPNIASEGHRRFNANWRGLEPPRHVHLFTREALAACAQTAGIGVKSLWTSARLAPGIWIESRAISKRKIGKAKKTGSLAGGLAFLLWERVVHVFRKDAGEELFLVGTPL